jgi:hypothetical protein
MGVIQCIIESMEKGIPWDGQKLSDVVGLSDADFAGENDQRRITKGYMLVMVGGVNQLEFSIASI